MITLPSPAEYERMSQAAREEAAALLHQVQHANRAERARLADARLGIASVDTAHVMVQAARLLPDIVATHGDTPTLQYERRAALAARRGRVSEGCVTNLLAIDPGNRESGWVVIDVASRRPLHFGKDPNLDVLDLVSSPHRPAYDSAVVEMVASYGMAVGADVFETCVWIGRFVQAVDHAHAIEAGLIKRQPVKVHHCHSAKAKDANLRQALVDRFAPGQPNHGKGTKADPGWFYGFRADIWQAYALAVYAADTTEGAA